MGESGSGAAATGGRVTEGQGGGPGAGADDVRVLAHPWLARYPERVDWYAPIPAATLHTLFDVAVSRFADRPCIDFLGKSYSYRLTGIIVDRVAKGLQALGIGQGTRVGLMLPNTPYYIFAYYGILKTGATVVNYNPLQVEREIARQIEDSGTDLIFTLDLAALLDKLRPLVGRTALRRVVVCAMADILPFPKNWFFRLFKRSTLAQVPINDAYVPFNLLTINSGEPAQVFVNPNRDIAVLQYTGGTTGRAKGAMLTHASLYSNTVQSGLWFHGAVPGEERVLCVLPFFHVFAMTVGMNLGLLKGAELILLPRFELDQVMSVIHNRKPTLFPAVPTIYTAINHHPRLKDFDLRSIRYCISGGAPLPQDVRENFERNTGCSLVEGYGLTEASPVVTCNPLDDGGKPGTIGLPFPDTVVDIVSLEDHQTVLPPGEKGEVRIQGPQVMAGYWKQPEETAQVLDKYGRLRTGDVGIMDEDGYITLVDRIKDVIFCSGYNVYPRLVEEALYQHPDVQECVVLGVPDPYRGETVKAFIRQRDGATLSAEILTAFLADKLSPMEMPKHVEFRDELPKTMIGKLSRQALREEKM